jgi:hypothetical protein
MNYTRVVLQNNRYYVQTMRSCLGENFWTSTHMFRWFKTKQKALKRAQKIDTKTTNAKLKQKTKSDYTVIDF